MVSFPELNANYRLVKESYEINQVQNLEKSLFLPFEYERDFLAFPFRQQFDVFRFLESHDFFRQEEQYNQLIKFLRTLRSSSFFISAPPYCGLYPLEISVDCPFRIYESAVSYVLEETYTDSQNQIKQRPLGHPQRGAGFVIMPHVFIYDKTESWAIVMEDNITSVAVLGMKQSVYQPFENSLAKADFTTVSEIVKTPNMRIYSEGFLNRLLETYTLYE